MPGTQPHLRLMAAATLTLEFPMAGEPTPTLPQPCSLCQRPHLSTSWAAATCCDTHTISAPQEGGWTPASQTNPANQPANHRHPIWPGKEFIYFCLNRLSFLVMSGGVDYDKGWPSLCARRAGRPQRTRGVSMWLG